MARQLVALGFEAAALSGGFNAWRATQLVEPKGSNGLVLQAADADEQPAHV